MSKKVSKKSSLLSINPKYVVDQKQCGFVKGGGRYYCCTRNQFITY